jgi:guanylate kinase
MEPNLSFDIYHPQPMLIVISGPSGAGKDSVVSEMKQRQMPFYFVVTATSRPPRPGEVHGKDYLFYSKDEFEAMIERNEFIEWAHVYQDYKGIPRAQVDKAMISGMDVVLRVDVQGAEKLRSLYPQAVLIFLVPTTIDEWLERLRARGTETEDALQLRTETARRELTRIGMFDYIVPNAQNQLDAAVDVVCAIIHAEHHHIPHRRILP